MADVERGRERRAPETDRRTVPEGDRKSANVRQAIRSELKKDADGADPVQRRPDVPVVQLEHVSLAFNVPILEDISFVADQGETICIVGESGTGKSTAL